jgi:hypothetical protein
MVISQLGKQKEGWCCDKEHKSLPQPLENDLVPVAVVSAMVNDAKAEMFDIMRQRLLDVAAGHDLLRKLIAQPILAFSSTSLSFSWLLSIIRGNGYHNITYFDINHIKKNISKLRNYKLGERFALYRR